MGAMWLVLLAPSGYKNTQVMVQPLLDAFLKLGTVGTSVIDASEPEASRVPRICRAMWLFLTNDTRGMPGCNLMRQAPAIIGACPRCDQAGYSLANRTVYMGGACRSLWMDHPLRKLYEKEFRGHPTASVHSSKLRPRRKTKELQRERGERVEAHQRATDRKRAAKEEGCYGVDAWTRTLGPQCNWDTVLMNLFCIAHIVMNLVKDVFYMMRGVKKGSYNAGRQAHDRRTSVRRHERMREKRFVVPKKARDKLDKEMASPELRMWQGANSGGRKLFKHLAFLKIHDCYLLLGARGNTLAPID